MSSASRTAAGGLWLLECIYFCLYKTNGAISNTAHVLNVSRYYQTIMLGLVQTGVFYTHIYGYLSPKRIGLTCQLVQVPIPYETNYYVY